MALNTRVHVDETFAEKSAVVSRVPYYHCITSFGNFAHSNLYFRVVYIKRTMAMGFRAINVIERPRGQLIPYLRKRQYKIREKIIIWGVSPVDSFSEKCKDVWIFVVYNPCSYHWEIRVEHSTLESILCNYESCYGWWLGDYFSIFLSIRTVVNKIINSIVECRHLQYTATCVQFDYKYCNFMKFPLFYWFLFYINKSHVPTFDRVKVWRTGPMFLFCFQAEPQRNWEAQEGQDEHVYHRALGDGTDVSRDVAEAGQADSAANGSSASQDYPRRGYLIHGRSLQARVPQRSGTQDAHTSSEFSLNIT